MTGKLEYAYHVLWYNRHRIIFFKYLDQSMKFNFPPTFSMWKYLVRNADKYVILRYFIYKLTVTR